MKDVITEKDRALLSGIRGTFAQSKKDTIKGLFFAYLFLMVCPALFGVALFYRGWPRLPLSYDQLALAAMIPVCIALGEFLRRMTGGRYVFDGENITQISRSGHLKKKIRIAEIIKLEVQEHPTPSMHIRTERSAMGLLLTPDLREQIGRMANQLPQPTSLKRRG